MSEPVLKGNEKKYVNEALDEGWISSKGKFIERFENEFSKYIGTKHGVAVNNGTSALHLALMALDIKAKDEVILPSLTSIACPNAITYVGAKPVFCDIDENTWCISPDLIEQKITKKTKAIMPVHLYGYPCDMNAIKEIADENDLFIVEDAAEAHGAEYNGKKVGSLSDISCFSFYGNKIITTGEGGMCLTDNKDLDYKMKVLRNQGTEKFKHEYYYKKMGNNFRMTNLQAAIGCAQLEQIDKFLKRREEISEIYSQELEEFIIERKDSYRVKEVCWYYSALFSKTSLNREKIIRLLKNKNIETRRFFYPLHKLPQFNCSYNLPKADSISESGLNLPTNLKHSNEDIYKITREIRKLHKG